MFTESNWVEHLESLEFIQFSKKKKQIYRQVNTQIDGKGGWRERERESEQERESESVLPCPRATKMNKALCVQGVWSPMELFGRQFLCYISLLKFFMRFSERR